MQYLAIPKTFEN